MHAGTTMPRYQVVLEFHDSPRGCGPPSSTLGSNPIPTATKEISSQSANNNKKPLLSSNDDSPQNAELRFCNASKRNNGRFCYCHRCSPLMMLQQIE